MNTRLSVDFVVILISHLCRPFHILDSIEFSQNIMTGKNKGRDLVVPELAEDAAQRKRVLNILAQRRYRKLLRTAILLYDPLIYCIRTKKEGATETVGVSVKSRW